MKTHDRPLHISLIAGEPSGDALGASLMKALLDLSGAEIRFSGVGGPLMQAQGLDSLFEYDELAIMGLVEVLPRIAAIYRRMRQTVAAIEADPPDALVTIDAPGFTVGIVKRLTSGEFPRIHYVAPTVWAWRPRRVHKFRRHFDHLMTLLPFEPPYFEAVGLKASFVGHPVIESGADAGDGARLRARYEIPEDAKLICVLPGSRAGEVRRMLPAFGGALEILRAARPDIRAVVPAMPAVEGLIREAARAWPVPVAIVPALDDRCDAMAASDVGLATSGTVSLELALARVPAVIAYRMAPATVWALRRLVKVKYANLINIIRDEGTVPEFIQDDATPKNLAGEIENILSSAARRDEILAAQDEAMTALGPPDGRPGARAAEIVLEEIARRPIPGR